VALRALTRTEVETLREIIEDDEMLLPETSPAQPAHAAAPAPVSTAPVLSDFTDKYIAKRGDGLSSERADSIRATVRDLIAIVGDKPMDTYSAADAETFEDVLLALPGNWMKIKPLRRLSIKAAANKAKSLGLPPQAPKTIRKKWSILFGLFKNAAIRHPLHNPFVAAALVVDDRGAANSEWDPFADAELTTLLASKRPKHLHWLTLLGLWTGARLNELCQLTKGHFREHNGLHYVYFSPELRLKTGEKESCVRAVPLHPKLIEAGILDYVNNCTDLLFPGIPQHKSGRYSDAPSKAFRRHLKRIGIKRPKLSFHSLRHTFVAAFRRCAPRDAETRERLIGHTVPGVTGRYGNSYESEAADMVLLVERAKALELVRV
jgi:integrase